MVACPSEQGFSPLDLLYATIAICLALIVRLAAQELGLTSQIDTTNVKVTGHKAKEGKSRLETFQIQISIKGALNFLQQAKISARKEELCTVSNTLHSGVKFEFTDAATATDFPK